MDPTWHRSVKRKLQQIEDDDSRRLVDDGGGGGDVSARVEVENEVSALREAVSRHHETIQDLFSDLEEERSAASTAASEAMSMILRLQREKAEVQMEFRQFKRFAEEKMAHDQEQLLALEDLVFKRDQALQSLSSQISAYKHRLLSYGGVDDYPQQLEDLQVDDDFGYDYDDCDYPPLKCMIPAAAAATATSGGDDDDDDDDDDDHSSEGSVIEKYTPTTLDQLQSRIYEMEAEKTMFVRDLDEEFKNEVQEETFSGDERHNSDDESDRVYTIDAIHGVANDEDAVGDNGVGGEMGNGGEVTKEMMEDGDIKRLYARLQALEADRESMRQAIISMRTEKAQLVLLKEIAQQLCKDAPPKRRVVNKPTSLFKCFSFAALVQWVLSIIFWRKKASRIKYSFGLSNNNVGLLLLLDKSPRLNQWRYLSSTRR